MIYKFKFEVCNDDNYLLYGRSEESGDFWSAFKQYMLHIMVYATKNHT